MQHQSHHHGIGVIGAMLIISLQGGLALVFWAICRALAQ